MKQFIVLAVSLPLMLGLLAQFSLNESNNMKLYLATAYVNAAKETAKQEGYFSEENRSNLAGEIAKVYGISADEVSIEGDIEKAKYRNSEGEDRYIEYSISFPSGRRTVSFFSKDEENCMLTFTGYVPSEVLQ